MSQTESSSLDFRGLMFIGDPHLESRVPGFRKDDYPETALHKLRWCLEFAREQGFQPFLLGDLFQLPQDNPNWLIAEIISIISEFTDGSLPAIYGNHDVRENSLKQNDSIQILFAGGHLQRIGSEDQAWSGTIGGQPVSVGGTVWGERLPKKTYFSDANKSSPVELSVWVTHHDILIPGYEEAGRIRPYAVDGLDLVINGHIHRRLDIVTKNQTHWVTAGNITRRSRSDASRSHQPAVPCVVPAQITEPTNPPPGQLFDTSAEASDWDSIYSFPFKSQRGTDWSIEWIRVPHRPFDEVFHAALENELFESDNGSEFIQDLRELTQRRTDSGAGLADYLKNHLTQFEKPVADEIWNLARQVADPGEFD